MKRPRAEELFKDDELDHSSSEDETRVLRSRQITNLFCGLDPRRSDR